MSESKSSKSLLITLSFIAIAAGFIVAQFGQPVLALGFLLMSAVGLLSIAEKHGYKTKTALTMSFGIVAFFIYASRFGIPGLAPQEQLFHAVEALSHSIHLEIFVFLAGLYLVVNSFSYSGLIGDIAWKIVKKTHGKLGPILVSIMILTCVLSGIFDGATIATIMGIITLTILLSSGMPIKDIVKILLLLVICTNLGGVWFVLGEPTNILAAEKLSLSPFFFLQYALPFSVPVLILCSVSAWRVAQKYPQVPADRPEMEVLLEGISLRRTHYGTGTLTDTIGSLGTVEPRLLREMERIIESESIPDFEAALRAGIPREKVYEALSINLNSPELAAGLIDYWMYREEGNPMAEILIGDLMLFVREEYKRRIRSRWMVIGSGILLISLLILHAFIPSFPTWASTLAAGSLSILAVQRKARLSIISQTWHNLSEAFFLIALFAIISLINFTGAFTALGTTLLNLGNTDLTGVGILTGSALLSGVADNVAVIDVLTNLIINHSEWNFFALAAIIGTALGGFLSPIASVQAVILAGIIRRVSNISFGAWMLRSVKYFLILLAASIAILLLMHLAGLPPVMPLPAGSVSPAAH